VDKISSYAVQTRYNVLFAREVSEKEAKDAIKLAEKVRGFVLREVEYEN